LEDFDVDQAATLGCILSMHPLSIDDVNKITCYLSVVRCAMTQLKENDDDVELQFFKLSLKLVVRIVGL